MKAGEVDAVGNLLDGIEALQGIYAAEDTGVADDAALLHTVQGVPEGPWPHQFQGLGDAGKGTGQFPGVQKGLVGLRQEGELVFPVGGGNHPAAQGLCQADGSIPQGTGAAPHQESVVLAKLQTFKQGTPGGKVGFRHRRHLCPGKRRLDGEDMACRQQGILGIAAVKAAAHAAHEGGHPLPLPKRTVRRIGNLADAFNAGDDGLLDIVRLDLAEAQDLLRMVHAEGADLHKDPPGADAGYRAVGQGNLLRRCGLGEDDRLHGGGDHPATSIQHWGSAA